MSNMRWRSVWPVRHVLYGGAALAALWVAGLSNYLLFHSLVETLGIVVASAMFAVAWNTRRFSTSGYLSYLAIAYLFVAGIDFVHMLAFKGMGVFPAEGANLATQLWVAARAMEAVALLVSPLFLARPVPLRPALAAHAAAMLVLFVLIYPLRLFPVCYVDAGPLRGLTPFKIWAEYVVCLVLLAALGAAWRGRRHFSPRVFRLVLAAIVVSILSELAFTQYVSVYGNFNMLGHLLKAASFLLLFDATVIATLQDPYNVLFRDLQQREVALRDSEQRAREAADRLGEANRVKDEFLATLSHELRTPVHAMVGWSEMLLRGQLDAAGAQRALEAIARNAKTQAQLVSDVLDVSRIVAGKLRLNVQPVDLSAVLENAVDVIRPAAAAKGIALECSVASVPTVVSGDPDRLQQILWNLLSNAVKFTPAGGRVDATLGPADSQLAVSITDTGAGIEPAFLPFVFDRFSQADSSTARTHGGLGLGLAIVRNLVELHGGTVRAHSDGKGKGATFTVLLPVRAVIAALPPQRHDRPHETPAVAVSSDDDRRMLQGVDIVAVDDEADARELVKAVLEHHGAGVRVAASAASAFELLRRQVPDVLVADIGMPGEDGYALIRRVRQEPSLAAVPAIALTAYGREEDRARVLNAGFQQHIVKPVVGDDLVAAIAGLVSA